MRRTLHALSLVLALAVASRGQDPKPPAPPSPAPVVVAGPSVAFAPVERVNVGDLAVIDASASVGDAFLWLQEDGEFFRSDGKKAFVVPQVAGKFHFTVFAAGVVDGKAKVVRGVAILDVIERPAPVPPPTPSPPTPTPPPTPVPVPPPTPPTPTPISGRIYVSLVVDANAMTPALAAIREGIKAREAFKGLDAVYHVYASTAPEVDSLGFRKCVTEAGTPCLLIQVLSPITGKAPLLTEKAEKAPVDEDALIQRIKVVRETGR